MSERDLPQTRPKMGALCVGVSWTVSILALLCGKTELPGQGASGASGRR